MILDIFDIINTAVRILPDRMYHIVVVNHNSRIRCGSGMRKICGDCPSLDRGLSSHPLWVEEAEPKQPYNYDQGDFGEQVIFIFAVTLILILHNKFTTGSIQYRE